MSSYDIIIRPVLTEKSYAGIPTKTYTFQVAKSANKVEIKNAIEEIFNVKVENVTTAIVKGKLKRQGRTEGHTPDWKKATVRLTSDSKAIEFFESLS
ncbi:MAG: 50S ribosomal protein L23 [Clostridia bacterium]|nr:50S ribosomal protein L23 [Clostridia bacterium]MBQ9706871.1 50S ribosomal protein L23 [Clostridia bacterium]MBR7177603.1 50S ribosomal protein L23 [Clostridia bacterium]